MTILLPIEEAKVYSAREAFQTLPGLFKTETAFRAFLREDIAGANIMNAKVYYTSKLARFVIRGEDLVRARQQLLK